MKAEKATKEDPRRSDKITAFHIPRHLEQEESLSETLQTAATLLGNSNLQPTAC
ncbi:hypothetical protein DSO57_1005463 [Entomophthora muscae]|uniref:Uncharacterized protein n=1 Tax=Entomophthora muscae TaxID=34485 RepID=A0ACC2T7Z7_9FUNG|nr:hypothetical protein DSO57_1005463 [Entomophthora muscae]